MLIFITIVVNISSGNIDKPERDGYFVAYQDDSVMILHPFMLSEKEFTRPMNELEQRKHYRKIRNKIERNMKNGGR